MKQLSLSPRVEAATRERVLYRAHVTQYQSSTAGAIFNECVSTRGRREHETRDLPLGQTLAKRRSLVGPQTKVLEAARVISELASISTFQSFGLLLFGCVV